MFKFNETLLNIVGPWVTTSGLKILGIIVFAFIIRKFSKIFIEKTIRKLIKSDSFSSKEAEEKRENTLIQIVEGTLNVSIVLIAFLMILQELGIAIGPVLAAAGIAGLAFGFGGQYLIRDVITGLFIILENQYRVGDVICLGDTCGSVESITLRMTSIRDLNGAVHHIPHGEIKKVSNLTKDYGKINLNIGIAYDSDIEKVTTTVNKVGRELATDPDWKDLIIKEPQFIRIQEFADSAMVIRIAGETISTKQWDVTGELRKRIKKAFDKEGIEIPFPQRVIHQNKG
ncbi:mechanosensitive ion channel family protein [Candidatus Nomurabacteria bacterium CG10_big_fil_rev_8_21_14_0_10_35_16]|uniref:Mechanosensitive ion channel family protein n=1 Tax=Candidatus Nomurabacteria bacterium CG10_big_fil_rev_8_21_14_0_10_35_16 TaxID=1974731 RepID=A0A2H0TAX9_9BACT|nr:MAG: mechanosensitive ion channel family protein [Candidatus Nomurabacteria bacterium CG10_big_fil_rev_8_21_14_0_10_35_16]